MNVILAGYNVDSGVLNEMISKCGHRQDVTPETLSAAYARISRDPRPIDEIRKDAREEVERTRRSNQTIIFKMGHHSVAEHAVFNFDIIGVSRYAMESLEKFRLCSYTEKSQRYITLTDDFVVPDEIKRSRFESDFASIIKEQNRLYHVLFDKLKDYVFNKYKDEAANPKNHNLLEGWAKEDARYVTSLATQAQVGLTVNGRNLELILRRFASHPLEEVKTLGRKMYEHVRKVAPSIIIFHEENDFNKETYPDLGRVSGKLMTDGSLETAAAPVVEGDDVRLVQYDENGDDLIAASLIFSTSGSSFTDCMERVKQMSEAEKKEIFATACQHLQFYDTLLREYEYAGLTYDMIISAACFGQLKRHRMTTITAQNYNTELGVTIPPSIKDIGMEREFRNVIQSTDNIYSRICKTLPHIAPYILTNAHQRHVLIRTNMRELYHMSRLREDTHAQWDIRERTIRMRQAAEKVMPLACMLLCGKDSFPAVYERVYGRSPKVREAVLPGVRKIEK